METVKTAPSRPGVPATGIVQIIIRRLFMKRLIILLVFILFFGPAIALSQESGYGAISGTVTDPSGAVVPRAQVTVTET